MTAGMLPIDEPDLEAQRRDYRDHLDSLILGRLRTALLLIVFVVVLDGAVQFLVRPPLFRELLWTRTVTLLASLLLLGCTRLRAARRAAYALSLGAFAAMALDIQAAIVSSGGYRSPFQSGLALLMIAAGLLLPYSLRQMSAAVALTWIAYLWPLLHRRPGAGDTWEGFATSAFFMVCSSAIALTAAHVTSRLRRQEFWSRRALEREEARSERLLLNTLPAPIIDRLKAGEDVISDAFDDVSVLFADIVGFTSFSERLAPAELVVFLDDLFSRFDGLSSKYGLEKIKTIGDAYMVVGGAPLPSEEHAVAVAGMALDMIEEVGRVRERTGWPLGIRVGIHSGPVVAGVIGRKKFAYDLWGDTVNTASRMESHGVAGHVQVSEATRRLLDGRFELRERGSIPVKGKGEMRVFLLAGRSSSERPGAGGRGGADAPGGPSPSGGTSPGRAPGTSG